MAAREPKRVYFHGDLPPATAEMLGEHRIDAKSDPVPLAHAKRSWGRCHSNMEEHLLDRLAQEVRRLGGCCAQIYEEHIVPKFDHGRGLYWLEGRYDYLLYRDPTDAETGDATPRSASRPG